MAITIDINKAKKVWKDKIRVKRTNALAKLDIDYMRANESGAAFDSSFGVADFLSNGFKPRYSGSSVNGSGVTYIYMAFAEQPLVGDNPATAR